MVGMCGSDGVLLQAAGWASAAKALPTLDKSDEDVAVCHNGGV